MEQLRPSKSVTKLGTPKIEWSDVQTAVTDLNKAKIEALGKRYNKPRLVQEGATVAEVQQQILSLAPGNHPAIGPLLLDLAAKL